MFLFRISNFFLDFSAVPWLYYRGFYDILASTLFGLSPSAFVELNISEDLVL